MWQKLVCENSPLVPGVWSTALASMSLMPGGNVVWPLNCWVVLVFTPRRLPLLDALIRGLRERKKSVPRASLEESFIWKTQLIISLDLVDIKAKTAFVQTPRYIFILLDLKKRSCISPSHLQSNYRSLRSFAGGESEDHLRIVSARFWNPPY